MTVARWDLRALLLHDLTLLCPAMTDRNREHMLSPQEPPALGGPVNDVDRQSEGGFSPPIPNFQAGSALPRKCETKEER